MKYWQVDNNGELSHNLLSAHRISALSFILGKSLPPQPLLQKILYGEEITTHPRAEQLALSKIKQFLQKVRNSYGQDCPEVKNAGALRLGNDLGCWLQAEGLSGPAIDILLLREGEISILDLAIGKITLEFEFNILCQILRQGFHWVTQ